MLFIASLSVVTNHCLVQAGSRGEFQRETGRRSRQTGGRRLTAQSDCTLKWWRHFKKESGRVLDGAAISSVRFFWGVHFIIHDFISVVPAQKPSGDPL